MIDRGQSSRRARNHRCVDSEEETTERCDNRAFRQIGVQFNADFSGVENCWLVHGEADYLLFVDGSPVGVVEAKKEGDTLTGVELQTTKYSEGVPDNLTMPRRRCPSSIRARVRLQPPL